MALAENAAQKFSTIPSVEAVTLAGSRTTEAADARSDFDVYVYATAEIPLDARRRIAETFAERIEINNQFWEPGDEWMDLQTGIGVDIMYRQPQWIEEQLDRVLVKHQAAVGYSTCFWYNVLFSKILYDRSDWFKQLQQHADQPYPEALRRAIVAKNHPILRRNISSYLHQLESAVARDDRVSVNHRTAALLASYFDVLFAVNRLPHPGEKRLAAFAQKFCARTPERMEDRINALITATANPHGHAAFIQAVNALIDGLETLLFAEALI
jgi:hypothetical protein